MRWGILALVATSAVVMDGGAFAPARWLQALGVAVAARPEVASPAAVDPALSPRPATPAATFSVFEDFPFGAAGTGNEAPPPATFDSPPIALDPHPQRFGPGRPATLLPDEPGSGPDPALASQGLGEAVLEAVLSDPLLRDLFGPGPLARFLEQILSAARGEGAELAAATHGTPPSSPRRAERSRFGDGLAVAAFPAAVGEPRSLARAGGAPAVASPLTPVPGDEAGGEDPASAVLPDAKDGAGSLPGRSPSPTPGQPAAGTGPAAGGTPPSAGASPAPTAPASPALSWDPPPWWDPGTVARPIAGPVGGADPLPPPRPELAPDPPLVPVAEPATLASFAVGLLGLLALRRPPSAGGRARA